jgi:hypothetical protein
MELVAALIGAVVGLFAAWLGATLTARQTRLERERQANQAVLRLSLRADALIDSESDSADKYGDPAARAAEEAVDQLALELQIAAAATSKKDRASLRTLATALLERSQVGPSPRRSAQRSVSAIRVIASARLYGERAGTWVDETLQHFREQLAAVDQMRRESFLAQQKWEREQLEARKRAKVEAAGEGAASNEQEV